MSLKIKRGLIVLIGVFVIVSSLNLVFAEEIDCDKITKEYLEKLRVTKDFIKLEKIFLSCKEKKYAWIKGHIVTALTWTKSPEAVPFLSKALKDEDFGIRLRAVSALAEIKDPRAIPALIEALKTDKKWELRSLVASALGKIKDPRAVPVLIEALKDEKNEVRKTAVEALGKFEDVRVISALSDLLKSDKSRWVKRAAVLALGETKDPRAIPALVEALSDKEFRSFALISLVDMVKFLSTKAKKNLAVQISKVINEDYSELKNKKELIHQSQQYAISINKLHDNDDEKDIVRTLISRNLTLRSKYYLIALGGPDLYTSSFFKIYKSLIKNENFLDEMKTVDPKSEYSVEFMLTLSSFGVLQNNIKKDPDYFLFSITQALENKENIIRNGGLLTSTITSILRSEDPELKEINEKIQILLLDLYDNYCGEPFRPELEFLEGKAVIGYLIKSNKDYFKDLNNAEEISKELPEILEPYVPQEWFNDNKIAVKMYFYSDEAWFGLARNYYANQIGIKEITSKEGEIVLKLKPGNGVKVKKEFLRKGIAVDVKKHVATIKLKRDEYIDLEITEEGKTFTNKGLTLYADGTTAIKKQVKEVEINLILTLDKSDVKEVIKDSAIDIMAHRGHSYHDRETFPEMEADCHKKLLYIGSCGSFRTVPELQETYDNVYYMSDQDIGRGDDNNRLLDYLTFVIASGERDWNKIKLFIEEKVGADGIVYPADKSMLLYDFVKRMGLGQKNN